MTTETYYFGKKNGSNGDRGTATKDESVFTIRELQNSWKLVSHSDAVKVELVYSKKDFSTLESLTAELRTQGYEVK